MDICAQLAAIGLEVARLIAEDVRAGCRAGNAPPETTSESAPKPKPQRPARPAPERIAGLEPKFHALLNTMDAEPAPAGETAHARLADYFKIRQAVRLIQYALRAPRLKPIEAGTLFHRLADCVRAFITLEIRLAAGNFKKLASVSKRINAFTGNIPETKTPTNEIQATHQHRTTLQLARRIARIIGANRNFADYATKLLRDAAAPKPHSTAPP